MLFCDHCLMNNQEPYSINETKHSKNSKKGHLIIEKMENAKHVIIMIIKKITLIG